jgi:DNA-binding GntR family transcriptional regulator
MHANPKSAGWFALDAFDEGACKGEFALARAAGGSRAQIRKALDNLEMTGRVRRNRSKAGTRIELVKFK